MLTPDDLLFDDILQDEPYIVEEPIVSQPRRDDIKLLSPDDLLVPDEEPEQP